MCCPGSYSILSLCLSAWPQHQTGPSRWHNVDGALNGPWIHEFIQYGSIIDGVLFLEGRWNTVAFLCPLPHILPPKLKHNMFEHVTIYLSFLMAISRWKNRHYCCRASVRFSFPSLPLFFFLPSSSNYYFFLLLTFAYYFSASTSI